MLSYEDIFLYIVLNYRYDYSVIYQDKIEEYIEQLYDENLVQYHFELLKQTSGTMDNFNAKELLKKLSHKKNDILEEDYNKIKRIYLRIAACQKELKEYQSDLEKNVKFGTCYDFAKTFKMICDEQGLPCSYIEGTVYYEGREYYHAWNGVKLGANEKFIDLASSIHVYDGTKDGVDVFDYFLVSKEELYKLDGNHERKILKKEIGTKQKRKVRKK